MAEVEAVYVKAFFFFLPLNSQEGQMMDKHAKVWYWPHTCSTTEIIINLQLQFTLQE